MEQTDRTELAVQWLTAVLDTALQRRSAVASRRGDRVYEQAAVIAYALAQVRHRLRRELDLPHDEHDLLADQLRDAVHEALDPDEGDQDEGRVVLFWPRAEFDALRLRWPTLAQEYGGRWDEHRARLQRGLVLMSESGPTRWELLDGAVDGLARFANHRGSDPADPDVRQGYVELLDRAHPHRRPWPHSATTPAGAALCEVQEMLPSAVAKLAGKPPIPLANNEFVAPTLRITA